MNICMYTSFLFLINSLIAFYYKYYYFAGLLMLLFFTSVIYHKDKKIETYFIDKIAIFLVFLYGYHLYCKKNNIICFIILLYFGFFMYIYIIGYFYHTYCFDHQNLKINDDSHSLIHILAFFINCYLML